MTIPYDLDIGQYSTNNTNNNTTYRLKSIINHIGANTHEGHYSTLRTINNSQGIILDDNNVTQINIDY